MDGLLSEHQASITIAIAIILPVLLFVALQASKPSDTTDQPINHTISKKQPKVVHMVNIEDLVEGCEGGKKMAYCRCWKSNKVMKYM